jgi:metallo-beta-lactamase class B
MKITSISLGIIGLITFCSQVLAQAPLDVQKGSLEVLSEDFFIPQLDRSRKIWVYLPPSYHSNSQEKYPVLYMHDGQTLFDADYSPTNKEWKIDETLDKLYNEGKIVGVIVVGIESDLKYREGEYLPYVQNGKGGEGKQYSEFVINTLKPYVDATYHTRPGRQFTAVAGASFGGLISLYMAREYNDVFGMSAIFSPMISWNKDGIFQLYSSSTESKSTRNYLVASKQEQGSMLPNLNTMYQLMERYKNPSSKNVLRFANEGQHDENFYSNEFEKAFLWMFNPQAITGFEDFADNENFKVYPNPAASQLNLSFNQKLGKLRINDMMGRVLYQDDAGYTTEKSIDLSFLKPGQYILTTDQGQRKVFIKN